MFIVKPVYASCPVCILTVGGGLIVAKKLGIDDLLISVWISGLNTAVAFWIAILIKKKPWNNPFLWSLIFYCLTIIYLLLTKQLGHPNNKFIGIDKVYFGISVGLITFFIAYYLDLLLRRKNNNKVLFPYQKVIIPVVCLTVITLIFKILLKK